MRVPLILLVLLLAQSVRATLIRVPEDQLTIAAGLAAADAGDTVLVAAGIYHETGLLLPDGVTLLGEGSQGWWDRTIIDGVGFGTLLRFDSPGEGRVESLLLRGGERGIHLDEGTLTLDDCVVEHCGGGYGAGAAVFVDSFTELRAFDTVFRLNSTASEGGAISVSHAGLHLERCIFAGNTAGFGGALALSGPAQVLELVACTFAYNAAGSGSAIYSECLNPFTLGNSILAHAVQGEALALGWNGVAPTLICCDVFGNAGGDWTEPIVDQLGQYGNISVDPEFCARPGEWNFDLQPDSPCAPGGNDCVELIGARDVNCAWTGTSESSWSAIKSLY